TADDVRQLLEQGEAQLESATPARLVLLDGNEPAIVDPDGKPLTGALGPCPNGDGEIKENRRAFGCSSWKSKDEPGCGFVIWKSMKGREITPEEAKQVIEQGSTGPLEFRDRQGPFTGRLVMTDDKSVEVVRADSAEAAA